MTTFHDGLWKCDPCMRIQTCNIQYKFTYFYHQQLALYSLLSWCTQVQTHVLHSVVSTVSIIMSNICYLSCILFDDKRVSRLMMLYISFAHKDENQWTIRTCYIADKLQSQILFYTYLQSYCMYL